MNLVTSLHAVITASYQVASPHCIAEAQAACAKVSTQKGTISPADMAGLNAAVEQGLGSSAALASTYCKCVGRIASDSKADAQNRITAGVATVERVLLAMTSHVHSEHTQWNGAYALAYLAWENPVNIAGIMTLGGLETLIASADNHIMSRKMQEIVCAALYTTARVSSEARKELCKGRASAVAVRANATHPNLYTPNALLEKLSTEFVSL